MLQNSLLWKITGKNTHPSWLFGTIHLVCAHEFNILPKVASAFRKCRVLHMEMDLGASPAHTTEDNIDIREGLSPKECAELEHILESEYNLTIGEANGQSAIFLINRMILKAIRCTEVTVYEMELLQLARQAGMPVFGLETLEEQMDIAATIYTPRELLKQLKLRPAYEEIFDRLSTAYAQENLNELEKMLGDREWMTPEMEALMVTSRNENWANQLPEILAGPSAFIAVGAGHLPGKQGLIHLLRNAGYRVNPVFR